MQQLRWKKRCADAILKPLGELGGFAWKKYTSRQDAENAKGVRGSLMPALALR